MNKSIKIKNIEIGEGIPKIGVSITGKNEKDIINEAEKYKSMNIDIIEWRADYYEYVENTCKVKNILDKLSYILADKPYIFTFRSKEEGGEKVINKEKYFKLNEEVIKTKRADIVDIELFTSEDKVKKLIRCAHDNKMKVIVSNHDFIKTPDEYEITKRMEKMISLGADIPKIAVMPQNEEDVLKLLKCTSSIKKKYNGLPIITMAMGSMGLISRLSGEIFGSAVTFGCVSNASAPGQIYYKDLKNILTIIHNNQ